VTDPYRIDSVEQLREVIPEPNPLIATKVFDHVDPYAKAFIERAPLLLLATGGGASGLDVSPKGDAPGFVAVDDDRTLLVPDRPGNKLAYGFQNILTSPEVGLIFIVPGVTETLRVNGTATLTRDPDVLERLAARGKASLLAIRVHVAECFFHCGKAFVRSALWKEETWPQGFSPQLGRQLARKAKLGDDVAAKIEEGLERDKREGLY